MKGREEGGGRAEKRGGREGRRSQEEGMEEEEGGVLKVLERIILKTTSKEILAAK